MRTETVGVLSVTFSTTGRPDDGIDAGTLAVLRKAAQELGYVLVGAGAWSDHVPVARRVRPMTLPAELQWS
ncbi:MAG TPA: hypothetical protein VFD41_14365, partial [Actinomycetales bacterium]|nr:hypothetical protein [Actinomycetales bacterium]